MDYVTIATIATTSAITALVGGVIGAIVSAVVGFIKDKKRGGDENIRAMKADAEAMREGMIALLWDKLKSIYDKAVRQGGLSAEDRQHLDIVYAAYHGIGGNNTGTLIYERCCEMPILS